MEENSMKKLFFYVVMILSIAAGVAMYFSGSFLPICVNGEFNIVNRVVRYVLYFALGAIAIYSAFKAAEE